MFTKAKETKYESNSYSIAEKEFIIEGDKPTFEDKYDYDDKIHIIA